MNGLLQDLRYALRQLSKNRGFGFIVLLVMVLGMAASVVMFSFVDAALIKQLPYAKSSRLFALFEITPSIRGALVSYPDFLDWKRRTNAFVSMDAYALNGGFTLSTREGAQEVTGTRVSSGFFQTLGVTPVVGRDFFVGEDASGAPRTVILSYRAWQKWFGGNRDVLGQTVTLNSIPNTIIAVLPKEFHFAPSGAADFWGTLRSTDHCEPDRGCHNLGVIARLKDGLSPVSARAEMQSIAQQLQKEFPESNRDESTVMVPLSRIITGDIGPILLMLLGAALLLFLIATINAASLLLARSDARRREIAIRGALGASPARLITLFATEGVVLVISAGLAGLMLAHFSMQVFTTLIPADIMGSMPYLQEPSLNWHDLAFAASLASIATAVFSVIPLLRVSPTALHEGLSEATRGSARTTWRRFGGKLVLAELALATILLVSAGLLDQSLYRLLRVDTGIQPDHVTTLQVKVPELEYSTTEQLVALERQIVAGVASLPGVKSVATANALPVSSGWGTTWFLVSGRAQSEHSETFNRKVSSGYFATLQARLLEGRYFTDAEDGSKPRVVIINQSLAKKYFLGQDPIGKQISYYDEPEHKMEVVGVVADIKESPLDSESGPAMYVPFNQNPEPDFGLAVRTSQSEQTLLLAVAAAIHHIDPGISTFNASTMRDLIEGSPTAYFHRLSAWLVSGFGCLSFILAVVGLYGVVAYSVGQRTREIGVRMALGAQRDSIYRLILREAGKLAAAGVSLGILASLGTGKLIGRLLFGVKSWDVSTLAFAAGALLASAFLACYIPARRAADVDPMVALRYE